MNGTPKYTFKELKHKTAAELKEIAKGIQHEAVQGYTQMNKEHLIKAICTAMNIPVHEHIEKQGLNRSALKARIRELKAQRTEALAKKDYATLKAIRLSIKRCKRKLRKSVL